MKLKQRVDDFIVEERLSLPPGERGAFRLYFLEKRDITTPDAVRQIARANGMHERRVSFAGLKDRHALARQTISVEGRDLSQLSFERFILRPAGRAERPVGPQDIVGNHFRIRIRDLSRAECGEVSRRLEMCRSRALPNYFDAQRFGSVRRGGRFVAPALVTGDFEGALKLALAGRCPEDRSTVRKIRKTVSENWRRWDELFALLPRSNERSVVSFLRDYPEDFRRAFELIPDGQRRFFLNAYQSHVWNRSLASLVEELAEEVWEYPHRGGVHVFTDGLDALEPLRGKAMPLPHRKMEGEDDLVERVRKTIEEEGLARNGFRIRGMKRTYFRKGARACLVEVRDLAVSPAQPDELNRDRSALEVSFSLGRGSYATIPIKFATGKPGP